MNLWLIPLSILVLLGGSAFFPFENNQLDAELLQSGDIAWMLSATGLVLLMTPGLSLFYAGMVSTRNIISTMLQSFICLGIVTVLWIVVGFSLAFGDSIGGLFGNPLTYLFFKDVSLGVNEQFAGTIPFVLFALFQMKFAVITPALITGSFAERVRFSGYLLFIALFTLFIYSPVAHWTWHPDGFLKKMGAIDFAGGIVVHSVAGFSALAGALFLGRRQTHQMSEPHTPCNVPFVLIGTGMLWFGWFGFNAGSALGANALACQAFLTTTTASASGMLAWIFLEGVRGKKPSSIGACIGAVVALVAITPGAGFVTVGASILIGTVSSIISSLCVQWRSNSFLDDTLDVFPCHGVGSIVGMLLTALFTTELNTFQEKFKLFQIHSLAIVLVGIFSFLGSLLLFWITDQIITLRVSSDEEKTGLDISQHGEFFGSQQDIKQKEQ